MPSQKRTSCRNTLFRFSQASIYVPVRWPSRLPFDLIPFNGSPVTRPVTSRPLSKGVLPFFGKKFSDDGRTHQREAKRRNLLLRVPRFASNNLMGVLLANLYYPMQDRFWQSLRPVTKDLTAIPAMPYG